MDAQDQTHAEQAMADGMLAALGRQWGAAPWYVGSFLVHLVVLAIVLLLSPAPKGIVPPGPTVVCTLPEELEPVTAVAPVPVPVDTAPEANPNPQPEVAVNIRVPDVIALPQFSQDDPSTEHEIVDGTVQSDADDTMVVTHVPGPSHRPGPGGGISVVRNPEAIKDNAQNADIDSATLKAIERGLAWLAKAQEFDGHWDSVRYEGRGRDVAVTALAELAFLSMGNSARSGKYRKNVRAAQEWLLQKRDAKTGRIGDYRYEAAITLMAMAESWAMSGDRRLAEVVQGQVDDAQKHQDAGGGWGYTTDADAIKAHVDTSVAGWWMMGMKSAKMAGAEVSPQAWQRAQAYFKSVAQTNKDKTVTSGYVGRGDSANMTAVGLTCLQFLGLNRDDPLVRGQADYFLQHPEAMAGFRTQISNPYYGWYYQALGLYQMGYKSAHWKKFSPQVQAVMLSVQEKTGADAGSWPLQMPWQKAASHFEEQIGRVGTTAMGCLILSPFRFGFAAEAEARHARQPERKL